MANSFSDQTDFTVLKVQRYIPDPLFQQQTGLNVSCNEAYDVTVTDGQYRSKLVLSCSFNKLVQKKNLYEGVRIRLVKVKMRVDETSLENRHIPVIEDMTVLEDNSLPLDATCLSNLPWYPANGAQQESTPLASSRGYYMDLWCNADVICSDDAEVNVQDHLEDVMSADLYSLKEVVEKWKEVQSAKPHVLVRVLCRSRLVHYARLDKQDKWPFQLPMIVGDHTGCCVAILWNALGPQYLRHLSEGQVLLLRNFRVKPKFPLLQHYPRRPLGLRWFDVDLSLNAHHPKGEVILLQNSVLDDLDVDLPLPSSNFVARKILSSLPDNYLCDVAGVITFVGITQRERMKVKQGAVSSGFWIKRWVFIQDNSSSHPVVVELYRGTQKQVFEEQLTPGMLMVCRNMRVVHGLDQLRTSRQNHHVFVTSTSDTQIYIQDRTAAEEFPFAEDTFFQSVLNWAKTANCDIMNEEKLQQIFFSYPPLPVSLQAVIDRKSSLEVIPSEAWKPFVDNLCYKETGQMVLQAKLISVYYHKKRGRQPSRVLRTKKSQFRATDDALAVVLESRETSMEATEIGYNHIHPPQSETYMPQGTTGHYADPDLHYEDFLFLQWQGLNASVILNTFKPCNFKECPPSTSLEACLSGALDSAPGEASVGITREAWQDITKSVKKERKDSSHRFLVIADVHSVGGDTPLVAVNRAFPLK